MGATAVLIVFDALGDEPNDGSCRRQRDFRGRGDHGRGRFRLTEDGFRVGLPRTAQKNSLQAGWKLTWLTKMRSGGNF